MFAGSEPDRSRRDVAKQLQRGQLGLNSLEVRQGNEPAILLMELNLINERRLKYPRGCPTNLPDKRMVLLSALCAVPWARSGREVARKWGIFFGLVGIS
jgi:hypothetical protein